MSHNTKESKKAVLNHQREMNKYFNVLKAKRLELMEIEIKEQIKKEEEAIIDLLRNL